MLGPPLQKLLTSKTSMPNDLSDALVKKREAIVIMIQKTVIGTRFVAIISLICNKLLWGTVATMAGVTIAFSFSQRTKEAISHNRAWCSTMNHFAVSPAHRRHQLQIINHTSYTINHALYTSRATHHTSEH